jgi:hypothetical protein
MNTLTEKWLSLEIDSRMKRSNLAALLSAEINLWLFKIKLNGDSVNEWTVLHFVGSTNLFSRNETWQRQVRNLQGYRSAGRQQRHRSPLAAAGPTSDNDPRNFKLSAIFLSFCSTLKVENISFPAPPALSTRCARVTHTLAAMNIFIFLF